MKEPRPGRTPARKRSVTKLLPSCYQGVTLRLHNWGVKRPGAPLLSFPFPSVTPGAPGFLTLRQGKKAGGLQDPSPISSSRLCPLAGLWVGAELVEMHRTSSSGIMRHVFVVRGGKRIWKEETNVCARDQGDL